MANDSVSDIFQMAGLDFGVEDVRSSTGIGSAAIPNPNERLTHYPLGGGTPRPPKEAVAPPPPPELP